MLTTTMIAMMPANVDCSEVTQRWNNHETVSKQEIQLCRDEMVQILGYDLKSQMKQLKADKNFCRTKWDSEINYRRPATKVEEALCGKKFKKYFNEELNYKKDQEEAFERNKGRPTRISLY